MRIRSFATPIGISLCFTFIGLGMYVAKFGIFFTHSLLTIGMSALSQESLTGTENILFLIMNILFSIIFSFIAIYKLKKTDVIT